MSQMNKRKPNINENSEIEKDKEFDIKSNSVTFLCDEINPIIKGTDLANMVHIEDSDKISDESSVEFYDPESTLRDLKRYPSDLDEVQGDDVPFGAALIKKGFSI
jgi:predicted RNA-binding protein with PUA-like domain